jgi:hypothetical protein
MAYTCDLAVLLPLPFRRGEGRGEGSICVAYPAASPVMPDFGVLSGSVGQCLQVCGTRAKLV